MVANMLRFMNYACFAFLLANYAAVKGMQDCFALTGDLANSGAAFSNANMDHEMCTSLCPESRYAVLEGEYCACSANMDLEPCADACIQPCGGDATQMCGNSNIPCATLLKLIPDCPGYCQELCDETVGGYECSCKEGHSLKSDGEMCFECQSDCTQICDETDSGHQCSCVEGFSLDSDLKTCTADAPIEPPAKDRLKRCKKGFLQFLHHVKKCGPVKSRYPKWALKHRRHRKL